MAANLAAQSDTLAVIDAATDKLAEHFEGDFTAIRKTSLATLISSTRDTALAKLASSSKTLLDKPDDPAANLIVGRYLCFVKGNYGRGLSMLIKTNHAILGNIAKQDFANPQQPDAQIEVGNAWWKLAGKSTDKDERHAYMERAKYWYLKALPSLSGLNKTKLEKRVEELAAQPDTSTAASKTLAPPPTNSSPGGQFKERFDARSRRRRKIGISPYPCRCIFDGQQRR